MPEESTKEFVQRTLQGMRDFTIGADVLSTRGKDVIPYLYPALDDKSLYFHQIACALIRLEANDKKTLRELRKRVKGPPQTWLGGTLVALGDIDWLTQKDPQTACLGATMQLGSLLPRLSVERPLDYSILESLLETYPSLKSRCEKELEPGRGYATPTPADIDMLERGAKSRFAVIRWHATSLLGQKSVRKRKRAFAALELRLSDRHRTVRRLALLSISWLGGKIPASTLEKARTLQDDKQKSVAETAIRLFS